jgi:hypothetical protein
MAFLLELRMELYAIFAVGGVIMIETWLSANASWATPRLQSTLRALHRHRRSLSLILLRRPDAMPDAHLLVEQNVAF